MHLRKPTAIVIRSSAARWDGGLMSASHSRLWMQQWPCVDRLRAAFITRTAARNMLPRSIATASLKPGSSALFPDHHPDERHALTHSPLSWIISKIYSNSTQFVSN